MIKKKFDSLFYFEPKSKIKAGAGHNKGQYPFYTSSGNLTKKWRLLNMQEIPSYLVPEDSPVSIFL